MTTPANNITGTQNEEQQLRLLRARREMYARAKTFLVAQLILTLAVPVAGAIFALFVPTLRPYVALAAILITVFDVTYLDRTQRRILKSSARIQEEFDCNTLELPWDQFTVGRRLEPETIHEAASKFARKKDDSSIRDWYPTAVAEVPLELARIICQRTNLWYDSKLRRHYGAIVLSVGVALVVVLAFSGLFAGITVAEFVVNLGAPAAPVLIWTLREFLRQRDTADQLDYLRGEAESLWDKAIAGTCSPDVCSAQSRKFQNAIFTRRATSPLIFDAVYWMQRPDLEGQMNEGAAHMVAKARSAIAPIKPPVDSKFGDARLGGPGKTK